MFVSLECNHVKLNTICPETRPDHIGRLLASINRSGDLYTTGLPLDQRARMVQKSSRFSSNVKQWLDLATRVNFRQSRDQEAGRSLQKRLVGSGGGRDGSRKRTTEIG